MAVIGDSEIQLCIVRGCAVLETCETSVVALVSMHVVCSHIVQEMPLGDFFDELYKFALKMNSLSLTDAEVGVLTAIMIMNPGQQ